MKIMSRQTIYDTGFKLGYNWKYGDPIPTFVIPDKEDIFGIIDFVIAANYRREAFNEGIKKKNSEILTSISDLNTGASTNYYEELTFEFAKLLRNSEGIHPLTLGKQIGQALTKLRSLNRERYDREVVGITKKKNLDIDRTTPLVDTISVYSIDTSSLQNQYYLEVVITHATSLNKNDPFFKACFWQPILNLHNSNVFANRYIFSYQKEKIELVEDLIRNTVINNYTLTKEALMLCFPELYE